MHFFFCMKEKTENQIPRSSDRKMKEPETGGSNVLMGQGGSSRWDSLMPGLNKMHPAMSKFLN